MKNRYFDYSATTPVDPKVLKEMLPYFVKKFGNCNSQHYFGKETMQAVDNARLKVASLINAKFEEIYFTSGGTESDNWAIKGFAYANKDKGKHILVCPIEHAAVLKSVEELSKDNFDVEYLKVDQDGYVDIDTLKQQIRKDTILIICMYVNNEIGTIEPIKQISEIAHKHNIAVFTDAVQAISVLDINVKDLNVDMLSFSSHKIYGPKGIGALYIKDGVKINGLIVGGHQEQTLRGGTINVPCVVGFGKACELIKEERQNNIEKLKHMQGIIINEILNNVENVKLNGPLNNRSPININFSFKSVEGESLLYSLDLDGIAVSSGSACSSGSIEPSHVLLAINREKEYLSGTIRISLGKYNTINDIRYLIKSIKNNVARLRAISCI